MADNSIYRFNVQKLNGEEINLSAYKDKVLLIVNTASQCGFTPQINELNALKAEFEGQGFEILAFPSNDFGGQEPLEGKGLESFCEIQKITYPVFDKIRVRGPYADPLYKFFSDKKENGKLSSVPRWNFHKFLINKSGLVTDFFYPFTKPTSSKIRKQVARLLAAGK
ncbi:glutathione peroxidase [Mucilaginibacter sp.]|uniref:glutathione peroxidase n=1 Tax=Mucilaginibacter sp. TaxID=1882438 RepID=UPI003D0E2EDB